VLNYNIDSIKNWNVACLADLGVTGFDLKGERSSQKGTNQSSSAVKSHDSHMLVLGQSQVLLHIVESVECQPIAAVFTALLPILVSNMFLLQ